ncbi:DUF1365 domain-containing protein [soil metagenome]
MTRSAIYDGQVGHTRLRPRAHSLRYRVFMLLIDLDEAQALGERLRWFSWERFNLLSLRTRDYGDGSNTPLKVQMQRRLAMAGIGGEVGQLRLLTLPRVLGYAFNPISVFYLHAPDGPLMAVLYEVNSTFGERHSYLIPATGDDIVRQAVDKRLHVSPFLDMDMRYRFKIAAPAARADFSIDVEDAEGLILKASFVGKRREFTDAAILSACVSHPLLTLKVVAAIHWEAIKLMLKGLKLRGGPPAPLDPVSVGVVEPAA